MPLPVLGGQHGITLGALPAGAFPQSISSPLGGQDCLCRCAAVHPSCCAVLSQVDHLLFYQNAARADS